MPFLNFLRQQAAALEEVRDFETLDSWHDQFARTWSPAATRLAASANSILGMEGEHMIRDELGYLVAQRSSALAPRRHRLVLVSANPGWSEVTNRRERELKGQPQVDGAPDIAAYQGFRRNFFPRWYDEVMKPKGPSRAAWWNRALLFMHRIAGLQKPPRMAAIHDDLDVLGWELWPLHSTRDGLSAAATGCSELDAFATASIRAACRVESDGVIIASKAGADRVLRMVGVEFDLVEEFRFANAPYGARLRHRATGRPVVVVAWQLFAGRSLPRAVVSALAAFARGEPTAVAPTRPRAPTSASASPALPAVAETIPEEGPIRVVRDTGHGTLIVAVHVCGHDGAVRALEPLSEDADDEEVHTRVGGYWVTGRLGGRAAEVQAALAQDRRVLIVGVHRGAVVRVLQVGWREDFPMPRTFEHGDGRTFLRWAHPPRWVAHPTRPGKNFATAYREVDVVGQPELRVRYHTHWFDDEAWVGRLLDDGGGRIPQTPPLYSIAASVE